MNRKSGRSAYLLTAIALAFCLSQGAQAADVSSDLIAKAKKEGEVTFYTIDVFTKPVTEGFTKKYGIKVNTVRLDNNDMVLRLTNELRADHPVADVITIALGVSTLIDGKYLRKYNSVNAAELNPKYRDPNGYWVTVVQQLHTGIINTSMIPEARRPKNYDDLLRPEFKDKIVWKPYDVTGGVGFIGHILSYMGDKAGTEYLRKLSKQGIKSINMSANALSDQIAAGEYPIALQVLSNHVERNKAKGAPVEYLNLLPIAVSLDVVALPAKSPHPNAGQLFAEFAISKEGQALYGQTYNPARSDVPKKSPYKLDNPAHFNVLSPNVVQAGQDHWKALYDELFR